MTSRIFALAIVAALLLPANAARAQEEENPITDAPREQQQKPEPPPAPEPVTPAPPPPMLVLGLGAGAYIPTSDLGPSFLVGIDVAYQFPWLDGRFGFGAGLAYSQPTISGELTDTRIQADGGKVQYDSTMQELVLSVLVSFRVFDWGSSWSPHVGIGPVFYFLSHNVRALEHDQSETSTQAGFVFTAGVDYHIWHGALIGEVRIPFATVGQRTTGDSNVGAISIVLGYRFRI